MKIPTRVTTRSDGFPRSSVGSLLIPPIHRHDAGAAEAQVVLERDSGIGDLPVARLSAELPHELGALGDARRAERVALREQAARGVGDEFATIGVVAVPDELLGLALAAQADGLVRQ